MWKALSKWLYYFCYLDFEASEKIILLNDYRGPFEDMVNTIILIVKYYIFVYKCLKRTPYFIEVVREISKYKKMEFIIASKQAKMDKIKNKWKMYDQI